MGRLYTCSTSIRSCLPPCLPRSTYGRIKFDFNGLGMAGGASADFLIGRVGFLAAYVADARARDAGDALEGEFDWKGGGEGEGGDGRKGKLKLCGKVYRSRTQDMRPQTREESEKER